MAYTGEKKMKSNNSTKYGRNDYISRKHKDVKDKDSKLRWKIGGQNDADDETFLPPKKKNSRGVWDAYEANDVRILHVEVETGIVFDPPSENWQKEMSTCFGIKVNNYHNIFPTRQVSINTRAAKHAQMRGDGNCLFRTFSYIIFGVQTHYAEIRQKNTEYMTKNRIIFEQYTNETLTNYLKSNTDLGRRKIGYG
ncbi:hypothetical protein CHS0354_039492 [Potamilus streckersoni]|uniref:OTU domain-containing protein n=1 Tax=Potamilus streckersoni TaxID=2493646 RepID=A0AAE0TKT7_9BIVA|nr:hypothetical protein CHS0354_039492 [Potamilus streckersoni]